MIDKFIVARAKREFPDFNVINQQEFVLPIYRLRVAATILQNSKLTIVSRFLLRSISIGVRTVQDIAELLGLKEDDIIEAGGELIQNGLIEQYGVDRMLKLTSAGDQFLKDEQIASLHRRIIKMDFDPLIKEVQPVDDLAISIEKVQKEGLLTIPIIQEPPTIEDFKMSDVKDIINFNRPEVVDLIELIKIDDCHIIYRTGMTIVLLKHSQNNQNKIAVFRHSSYMATISIALQQLINTGTKILPQEFYEADQDECKLPASLTKDEISTTTTISELDTRKESISSEIGLLQERQSSTQEIDERNKLAEELKLLEEKYHQVTNDLALALQSLKSQTNGTIEIIPTEKNHDLLIKAISTAKKEIIIISPWMDIKVFDEDLLNSIKNAFLRDVKIKIAWGFGLSRNDSEADRRKIKAKPIINILRNLAKTKESLLDIREVETHEKILICDESFCAVGSFNWLSYRGDIDPQYRRESSYYSERPIDIKLFKERVSEIFS